MVVVFGSINVDFVARVPSFPRPGETLASQGFAVHAGGKGANQALAAARAGASVRLFGAVGQDAFAPVALEHLSAGGVDLNGVTRCAEPTGSATILVDAHGENCIVIAAGANARADPDFLPDAILGAGTTLVLQHEVGEAANAGLLARARRLGARVVLNAAPARPVGAEALDALDVLVVNESEAAALAASHGWPTEGAAFARAAARAHPGLTAVVTLGARGAIAVDGAALLSASAPPVDVVDATAAGDAFVGVLAATLDAGASLPDALRRAIAAGTLACTAHGAQPSLPDRAAMDALLPLVTED